MIRTWEKPKSSVDWVTHRLSNASMKRRVKPPQKLPQNYDEGVQARIAALLRSFSKPPLDLTVVEHERLDPADPEHGTWRVAVEGSGAPAYTPGDMLYLRWRNDPAQVEDLLQRLRAAGTESVRVMTASSPYCPGRFITTTLRDALTSYVEIQEASPALMRRAGLARMADHNDERHAAHRRYHRQAARGKNVEHPTMNLYHVHLPSLLDAMGSDLPTPEEFVAMQERISGRPYTISAFRRLPNDRFRAEITVSQVEKEMHLPGGGTISAPARTSTFLSAISPGEPVHGWILPELHRFPVSIGRRVPTIVVCTGSGISGLMSLLRSGDVGGPLWVVYGVRSWQRKHLYGPDLGAFHAAGDIARIDVASSRPQPGDGPARRVQHLLWEEREELARWLRDGAHIYLSGRLSMGHDATHTITHILLDQGLAADQAEAERTIDQWHHDLRLQASVSGV